MRRPMVLLRVFDHPGPDRIHVDVDHDLDAIGIGFHDRGTEAIHDHLPPAFIFFIIGLGEDGIHDTKIIGEEPGIFTMARQMGMVRHQAEVMEVDFILFGVFYNEVDVMGLGRGIG